MIRKVWFGQDLRDQNSKLSAGEFIDFGLEGCKGLMDSFIHSNYEHLPPTMIIFDHQNSKKFDQSSMLYYFPRNSSAKEGMDNKVKQGKTKLGKFEMQLLAYVQPREKEFISSLKYQR